MYVLVKLQFHDEGRGQYTTMEEGDTYFWVFEVGCLTDF